MSCMLILVCSLVSCGWNGSQEVIAEAEKIDKAEHIIYDDTAALGGVIRKLDNPMGRLFYKNTLGKAYYYMGRNLEDSYYEIAEAARCYITADRLQIDDPIYRGRVNSCMGYICKQNNNDSVALIFYERASEAFKETGNKWRYAQSLLNIASCYVNLGLFITADSLMQIARTFELGDTYVAHYSKTRGLYFETQQKYDSALVYFKYAFTKMENDEERLYNYLKIMQAYYDLGDISQSLSYAQYIVKHSTNPNYLVNAYYCLMQDAKEKDNAQQLSIYSHARTDAQKLLRDCMIKDAEALPILEEYLLNPHPWRRLQIIFTMVVILFLLLGIGLWYYRKHSNSAHEQLDVLSAHIRTQEEDLFHHQSLLEFEQNRLNLLEKYHTPHKRWRNYLSLKRDIDPWMHEWLQVLDTLSLSEQEKIFCAISLIYPHMTDVEIADFICYSKAGIRVFKNRIFKKLGIASSDFADFLRKLSLPR